jgi:predicted RNase H-like HicB family nuclease
MIKLLENNGFQVVSQNGSHIKLKNKEDAMNRLFYPAVFHTAEEGGFWITFPDFPECMTQGETVEEAYEMAADALGLCIADMEREKCELPKPSEPNAISIEPNTFIMLVEFNMEAYRKKHSSRAVKKTLSIPEWLNEEATALNLNCSQILQEALIQKIEAKR